MPPVQDAALETSAAPTGEHRQQSTFAARDSCGGRFFAIPFDAIPGFEDVAEAARSLTTLPVGLDLDRFAQAGEDSAVGRERSRLLTVPDVERMSFNERQREGERRLNLMTRYIKTTRRRGREVQAKPIVEEEHKWLTGPINCFFSTPSPRSPRTAPLRRSMERFFGGECPCISDQFYPPGSCREWHTDRFGYVGWVVFLVTVEQPGKSSFRYMDPRTGELVVVPDQNEVAYFFRVSAEEPLFWHGVLCESTNRWSWGFRIPQNRQSRIRLETPDG